MSVSGGISANGAISSLGASLFVIPEEGDDFELFSPQEITEAQEATQSLSVMPAAVSPRIFIKEDPNVAKQWLASLIHQSGDPQAWISKVSLNAEIAQWRFDLTTTLKEDALRTLIIQSVEKNTVSQEFGVSLFAAESESPKGCTSFSLILQRV